MVCHSLCRLTAYTLQRLPELLILPDPLPDDVVEILFAEPLSSALGSGLAEALKVAAETQPGSADDGCLLQTPSLGLKGHSSGSSERRARTGSSALGARACSLAMGSSATH